VLAYQSREKVNLHLVQRAGAPTTFTQFYDKLKDDRGWTVHNAAVGAFPLDL
jgi:hypothetical protein